MRTHPSPIARHVLLALVTFLLIRPLTFSQASGNGSIQPEAKTAAAPLELASLMRDSSSAENWPSSRVGAEPLPAAPVVAIQPAQFPNPESHAFWDRQNRTLFIAVGTMAAADFCVTHANLSSGGRELNPITRVFSGSTAGLATNFALETGGVIGVSYLFHKSGHHKLERLTSYVNIGASAGAVTYGLTHR